jgi:hypothetical protein
MAIDNFPPIITPYIEQQGFLEKGFETAMEPELAYRKIAERVDVEVKNGESVTKTRPSLFALGNTAVNPATNTGLDNGLSNSFYGFEQFTLSIGQQALTTQVSLEQQETLIEKLFLQNQKNLAIHAASTLDQLNAQQLHSAYDSGSSYNPTLVNSGATSIELDNIIGFDTNFAHVTYNSVVYPVGTPQPVSSSNTLKVNVYTSAAGNALLGQITVTLATPDGTNISTAFVNGIAYGVSGTLTCTATGFAIPANSTFVAVDGSYVLRPNGKLNRAALASTDTLSLSLFAIARAKLAARAVPTLPNGMYACIIDPNIYSQLLNDTAFQVATQGTYRTEPYFKKGILAPAFNLEFVSSNMVPSYTIPSSNLKARHAMVVGADCMIEGDFVGARHQAASNNAMNGPTVIRMYDDIQMTLRAAIDRFGDTVTQTWKWTGGFVAGTDILSDTTKVPTTDGCRYKRCVEIEVASAI